MSRSGVDAADGDEDNDGRDDLLHVGEGGGDGGVVAGDATGGEDAVCGRIPERNTARERRRSLLSGSFRREGARGRANSQGCHVCSSNGKARLGQISCTG
jgi:hypothetical protein